MQPPNQGNDVINGQVVGLIGVSPWSQRIRTQVVEVAACPSNVLITGPTGTGKEVIAQSVHRLSPRANKPFIPVDCAGASGPLFASHIFGHLKGAFTGAGYTSLGCFRAAHEGTIFLDEIGELESDMQIKLLRVLQQRTVTPVGSHQPVPVDVRVIAATNRDLEREVREGRFREDLYYRLNVVSLKTLPLRERPEDIEALAEHFLGKLAIVHGLPAARISAGALRDLRSRAWPGNVRQLENVLERAAFSNRGSMIEAENVFASDAGCGPTLAADTLPLPLLPAAAPCGAANRGECCMAAVDGHWRTMEEVECEHIRRTLELTAWNQSSAARILGMERHQLARKIRKYGLDAGGVKPRPAARRAA
jgi:DNA-binding NtrC family response regulator